MAAALMLALAACGDPEVEENGSLKEAYPRNFHLEFPTVLRYAAGQNFYPLRWIFQGEGRVAAPSDRRDVWVVAHAEPRDDVPPGRSVGIRATTLTYRNGEWWGDTVRSCPMYVRISTCASDCRALASWRFAAEAYVTSEPDDPYDREPADLQPVGPFDVAPSVLYAIEIEMSEGGECGAMYQLEVHSY